MPKLCELTSLIRSKNAGPFNLTFDIMFSDAENYERVKKADTLTPEIVGRLYKCSPNQVRFYVCDNALAFKFTIPRPVPQGSLGDGDMHGGQQFAPLMDLPVA